MYELYFHHLLACLLDFANLWAPRHICKLLYAPMGDLSISNDILMHSNLSCNYLLQQPMTSQGWILYTYSIQISVMLQFQSPLFVNLHVWLVILWVQLICHLGSISTWYQSFFRSIYLLPYFYCRFNILTGSILLTKGHTF